MRQQGFFEQAGRGGQQVDAIGHREFQPFNAEALGADCRAQQVAIIEQQLAVVFQPDGFAVGGVQKLRIGAQPCGQGLRGLGALGGAAAFDADQDQARADAGFELVDQQLLFRSGCARQEGGKIGSETGAADQHDADGDQCQPHGNGDAAPPGHGAPTF